MKFKAMSRVLTWAGPMTMLLTGLLIVPAQAFKVLTHVAVANRALDELQSTLALTPAGNKVVFHGITVDIQATEAYKAVLDYPQYFRMGAVGPDGFPDIITGQGFLHVNNGEKKGVPTSVPHEERENAKKFRSIDYAMLLLKEAREKYPEDKRILAFVLGFFGHCVGDGFAHTYVNKVAHGAWSLTEGDGLYENQTEEVKHIAVEALIESRLPAHLVNSSGAKAGIFDRADGASPVDFLDGVFSTQQTKDGIFGEEYVGGPMYKYFGIQHKVIREIRKTAVGPLTKIDEYSTKILAYWLADGLVNLAKDYPALQSMLEVVADDLVKKVAENLNPLHHYIDEISDNLNDHEKKAEAFRRNWILISECTMQNVLKTEATGNPDACLEAKGRIEDFGMTGKNRDLYHDQMNEIFTLAKGKDHHSLSDNLSRNLAYLRASFILLDASEIIVPTGLITGWRGFQKWVKDNEEELDIILYPAATTLAEFGCGMGHGVCTGKAFEAAGKCAGRCHEGMTRCLGNSESDCRLSNTHRKEVCVPYFKCSKWKCRKRYHCSSVTVFDPVGYGLCLPYKLGKCSEDHAVEALVCQAGCDGNLARAEGQCLEDRAKCTWQNLKNENSVEKLTAAVEKIMEPVEKLKSLMEGLILNVLCEVAEHYEVPIKELHQAIDMYASFQQFTGDKALTAVNMTFLHEDLQDSAYKGKLLASELSPVAKAFLEKVAQGGAKPHHFQRGQIKPTPKEVWLGRASHCLEFNFEKGSYAGDNVFSELIKSPIITREPGPTARRILADIGPDMVNDFEPFYNALQATKLIPMNSQRDVEAMYTKAGAPLDGLPWRLQAAPYRGYSALSKEPHLVNLFHDVIPSLDDPECFGCMDKPLGLGLKGNLEIAGNPDAWVWKRSLAAWNDSQQRAETARPYSNTPFVLANSDGVRERLYTKIFRMPGERIYSEDFTSPFPGDTVSNPSEWGFESIQYWVARRDDAISPPNAFLESTSPGDFLARSSLFSRRFDKPAARNTYGMVAEWKVRLPTLNTGASWREQNKLWFSLIATDGTQYRLLWKPNRAEDQYTSYDFELTRIKNGETVVLGRGFSRKVTPTGAWLQFRLEFHPTEGDDPESGLIRVLYDNGSGKGETCLSLKETSNVAFDRFTMEYKTGTGTQNYRAWVDDFLIRTGAGY